MRISVRLTVAFLLIAALVALLGTLSHQTNREVQQQVEQLSRNSIVQAADANSMLVALNRTQMAAYRLVAERTGSQRNADNPADSIERHLQAFDSSLERSRQSTESFMEEAARGGRSELLAQEEETLDNLNRLASEFRGYRRELGRFRELLNSAGDEARADDEARMVLNTTLHQRYLAMLPQLQAFRSQAEAEATREIRTVERILINANRRNSMMTLLSILAAAALGLLFSRWLGQRLAMLQRATEQIGQGDWTPRLPASSADELGILALAFNRMAADLQATSVSLKEKEVLLQEIHHRVKNNLQIISSLLSLQAAATNDADTLRMFRECQDRIRSMSLLHEQLYQSSDLAEVDFAAYLHELARHLSRSYGAAERGIMITFRVDPVPLSPEFVIPCGMIANELISNALKHAFPDDGAGEIAVSFHCDEGRYCLAVRDNGIDMTPEAAEAPASSLGLRVVGALVEQLRGELNVVKQEGKAFVVTFAPRLLLAPPSRAAICQPVA